MNKAYMRHVVMPTSTDDVIESISMIADFDEDVITLSFRDTADVEVHSISLQMGEALRFSEEIKWLLNIQ